MLKATGEKNPTFPMYAALDPNTGAPIKSGLFDPDNSLTQLVLWIHSMEPSFYLDLMRAAREINMNKLDDFGPFAFAMNQILLHGETNKTNKVPLGVTLYDPDNND